MLKRSCFVFMWVMAANTEAAMLYKCTGPAKDAVSIQSDPCPAGATQVWARDGTPEAAPTYEQLRGRETRSLEAVEQTPSPSPREGKQIAGKTREPDAAPVSARTRCDTARQQAKTIRDRDKKMLTVEHLRKLDTWVKSECRKVN